MYDVYPILKGESRETRFSLCEIERSSVLTTMCLDKLRNSNYSRSKLWYSLTPVRAERYRG